MENVTKVFFDPLARTKAGIAVLLKSLPVGSAHPFRPDGVLLYHSKSGDVKEIDISMHSEDYFSNAVSLADLGEGVLQRMKLFQNHIGKFNDEYMIQQAPGATFTVPLADNEIMIFAVSKRKPTYYDLCMANSGQKTSCFSSSAQNTFPGLTHSGDINAGDVLLQHFKINTTSLTEEEYAVFVSGYSNTKLTKYKEENPVVLVANHADKILYVVPVPLDAASIGDAILCVPMVVKASKADSSLLCSILPTPTTDDELMCSGSTLPSDCFKKAVDRADFTLESPESNIMQRDETMEAGEAGLGNPSQSSMEIEAKATVDIESLMTKKHLVLATQMATIPDIVATRADQITRFGNGIDWVTAGQSTATSGRSSSVLPCILGGVLEGPLLLATGEAPVGVPFSSDTDLRRFYRQAESVVVVVDENMTDNARNLSNLWRINALFIVQAGENIASGKTNIGPLLDGVNTNAVLDGLNINAVTALAGPQSLILAQIGKKYYFYRGIASHEQFDVSQMKFGQDVTEILKSLEVGALMDAKWPRLVNLSHENKIFLPKSKQAIDPQQLKDLFEEAQLKDIASFKDDILAVIPQLQALLSQKDLESLCASVLTIVHSKITNSTMTIKDAFVNFLTTDRKVGDTEWQKKKETMLAELRRASKDAQSSIGWLTDALGNVISSQTTSTRKHDLKRLLRKNAIQSNVDAVKSMNFEHLAGLLEQYAEEMGVLLVNVDTARYQQLLSDRAYGVATVSSSCNLDNRILHLEGFDAGIVLEQSQSGHSGPLVSQSGPARPILALPYLNKHSGTGSMLAWVCWDEFVNLENPYSIRWVEKCNDAHIAALRIMMRSTLSNAVSSREHNMTASSVETGQLMASLLMATMDKLAKMRTTAPTTVDAGNTSTKLMRGLFGHLLTVAGSGTRPLSMVWQLFGTNPQFDVPPDPTAWGWYENVTRLFPYTGWPAMQFHVNLEQLLDKVIFRLITKNKLTDSASRLLGKNHAEACKARNVQLLHSRTIITAMMKMLTEQGDYKRVAENLLQTVPEHVENETDSYKMMHYYLEHLADGGQKRSADNLTAANVYTKRSAAFGDLKKALRTAATDGDEEKVKKICQQIIDKRSKIGKVWGVEPEEVKVQGIQTIEALLSAEPLETEKTKDLYQRVKSDAEQYRQPWQIGQGEYGIIEPLDSKLLKLIMTGSMSGEVPKTLVLADKKEAVGLMKFEKIANPTFLKLVEEMQDSKQVCASLQIPTTMMETFVQVLAPKFQMDQLPATFRTAVYNLLKNPNQETSHPARQLFGPPAVEN